MLSSMSWVQRYITWRGRPSPHELTRNGQVLVRGGQVWYQNVQLDELNPMMYHTWGWVVGNPFRPTSSISPVPKWTPPKNDKYFVSAQNSCLIYHYSSSTLISEIFIKVREGAFRDVPCKFEIVYFVLFILGSVQLSLI